MSEEKMTLDDGQSKVDHNPPVLTFDTTMKKKKKKKPADTNDGVLATSDDAHTGQETPQFSSTSQPSSYTFTEYTYKDLLSRLFSILRESNPELSGDRKKFSIIPPQISREGSKKTAFSNITDFCRRMSRPTDHLIAFLLTELSTTGSSDASGRLLIKGRFQQLQVESVLKRYIQEYVTCKTCKAPETRLVKDNTSRLMFMECEKCSSRRSVAPIKSGFKK